MVGRHIHVRNVGADLQVCPVLPCGLPHFAMTATDVGALPATPISIRHDMHNMRRYVVQGERRCAGANITANVANVAANGANVVAQGRHAGLPLRTWVR